MERSESQSLPFRAFRAKVRNEYGLVGELIAYRATEDKDTGCLVQGDEIYEEEELTLEEGEHILLINDTEAKVVPGGYGEGADIMTHHHEAPIAKGGRGTGGRIDEEGNVKGGDGFGGDGHGKNIFGKAGGGFGAPASALAPGTTVKGGHGVAGDLRYESDDKKPH